MQGGQTLDVQGGKVTHIENITIGDNRPDYPYKDGEDYRLDLMVLGGHLGHLISIRTAERNGKPVFSVVGWRGTTQAALICYNAGDRSAPDVPE